MNYCIIVLLGISVLFFSIPTEVFGEEIVPEWSLFFLTNEHRCLNEEKTITAELTSVAKKYLKNYEFDNKHLGSTCIPFSEYAPNSISNDTSLIILVLDDNIGQSVLIKNGYRGTYSHLGDDKSIKHTIIIKQTTANDLYTSPPTSWKLSHHLSHYVLSYKGYNANAIEYLLHNGTASYNDCTGRTSVHTQCGQIKTSLRPDDMGKDFFVKPVYEPVVGKSQIRYLTTDILSSKVIIELQREITKWWLDGQIDDKKFGNSIAYLLNSPKVINNTHSDSVSLLSNGFVLYDFDIKKIDTWNSGPFNAFADNNDPGQMLSLIPFEADDIVYTSDEFPNWFKLRAQLWVDKKIPDKIYFDGIEAMLRLGIIKQ